nr:hypothetical protein [Tanacetum cinerariifolium]
MPPRRNNRRNETPELDPAFAAAVQQAVRALLPELTAEIIAGMNNANNVNNGNNAFCGLLRVEFFGTGS